MPSLKYLGMSFWWAWGFTCYGGFVDLDGAPVSLQGVFLLSTISLVATAAAFLLSRKAAALLDSGSFVACCGLLGTLGSAGIYCFDFLPMGFGWTLVLSAVFSGICSGTLAIKAANIYGTTAPALAIRHTLSGSFFALTLYFVIIGSPAPFGQLLFVSLLLVSALLMLLADHEETTPENDPSQYLNPSPAIGRLLAFIAFFFAVTSFERGFFAPPQYLLTPNVAMVLMVLSLAILFTSILAKQNWAKAFVNNYNPIMLGFVILLSAGTIFGSQNDFLYILSDAALFATETQTVALFAFVSYQAKTNPVKVFAAGHLSSGIGVIAGNVLAQCLPATPFDPYVLSIVTLLVIVIAFAIVITVVLPREKLGEIIMSIPDEESDDARETEKSAADGSSGWKSKYLAVSEKFGFSEREKEVYILLVHGHGSNHIAEKLCISYYTVRAHTRNIYTKTGVHSRRELIELTEGIPLPHK